MKKIKFRLQSLVPLKMDRWVDGVKLKTEQDYINHAEKKVYRDEKGNIGIPSMAIKSTIKCASPELVKKMESKKIKQSVEAGIYFDLEVIPFTPLKKNHDGIVRDIITRTERANKVTRLPTYRPIIKNWELEGTMNLVEEVGVTEELVKGALNLAGIKYGLLSHRPSFGRFKLTKWEVLK